MRWHPMQPAGPDGTCPLPGLTASEMGNWRAEQHRKAEGLGYIQQQRLAAQGSRVLSLGEQARAYMIVGDGYHADRLLDKMADLLGRDIHNDADWVSDDESLIA